MELYLSLQSYLFPFVTCFKSFLSTTSRELRQQFAACSGLNGLILASSRMCRATRDNNNSQEGQHMNTLSAAYG